MYHILNISATKTRKSATLKDMINLSLDQNHSFISLAFAGPVLGLTEGHAAQVEGGHVQPGPSHLPPPPGGWSWGCWTAGTFTGQTPKVSLNNVQ